MVIVFAAKLTEAEVTPDNEFTLFSTLLAHTATHFQNRQSTFFHHIDSSLRFLLNGP